MLFIGQLLVFSNNHVIGRHRFDCDPSFIRMAFAFIPIMGYQESGQKLAIIESRCMILKL
jgi:hypothetical protein